VKSQAKQNVSANPGHSCLHAPHLVKPAPTMAAIRHRTKLRSFIIDGILFMIGA
jgi:hypothetical protein